MWSQVNTNIMSTVMVSQTIVKSSLLKVLGGRGEHVHETTLHLEGSSQCKHVTTYIAVL